MKKIFFILTLFLTTVILVSCDTLEITSFSATLKTNENLVVYENDNLNLDLFELKLNYEDGTSKVITEDGGYKN